MKDALDAIAAAMKAAALAAQKMHDAATAAAGPTPWAWDSKVLKKHIAASNPANVLAVLEAYERLKHIAARTQRSRRYSSEQWAQAAKEAMAGDFSNLRNRVELSELPPVRQESDSVDGSPLLVLDGERLATIDASRDSLASLLKEADNALAISTGDTFAELRAKIARALA